MTGGNDNQWVTIGQAAAILEKSERTIRRWVASGRLSVDKAAIPHKVDIAAELSASDEAAPPDTDQSPRTDNDAPDADINGVRLQAEIDRLQALLDDTRADRDYLRQALAAALSDRKQVEAGQPRRWRWPWQREE